MTTTTQDQSLLIRPALSSDRNTDSLTHFKSVRMRMVKCKCGGDD